MRTRLFAALISLVVRVWLATLRIRYLGTAPVGPGFVAFWHGDQLPLLAVRPSGALVAPISLSRDGRLQAAVLRRFGIGEAPGSSSRGGLGAARALLRALSQGALALIAVDGPRGPRGRAKPGIVHLAHRTGHPVWPVGVAVRRGRRLKAWDRFLLPCPFTRTVILVGPPVPILGTEDDLGRLEAALDQVTTEARKSL